MNFTCLSLSPRNHPAEQHRLSELLANKTENTVTVFMSSLTNKRDDEDPKNKLKQR